MTRLRKNPLLLRRKAFMTLLETMIALSLLAVLLVFVFGVFRELTVISRLTETNQKESFQMRYLESRLGFIFERIVNENQTARKFFFYTEPPHSEISSSPSLIFTFDNGVRLNPTFSGDILGRIFVDREKRLCLVTWPLHVSEPRELMEEEVLIEGVTGIEFSLYAAPARVLDDKESTTGEQINPEKTMPAKDTWHSEWAITYKQMPSILKMTVEFAQNDEELSKTKEENKVQKKQVFHFVLPSCKNPVYYPPGTFVS